mgnify:CR=1 FL=1
MKTLAPRVLPRNIEVEGHVEDGLEKSIDFFCERLKKEKLPYAVDDTAEEFRANVRIEEQTNKFNENAKKYNVYISKKEHS